MNRSRVRELRLPLTLIFGGSAVLGLGLVALFAALGTDLGLNLTVVDLILAIFLPLGIELRNRASHPRRVLVLD